MSATASRGDQVVGVSVAFLVVAVLLTIVRFLTRILIVRNFGPEDWTIGAATVCLSSVVRIRTPWACH